MAINRALNWLKTIQPELVVIAGRVAIGATGAVGASTGKGFTVTRTGAGLYTITLDAAGAVPALLFGMADVVFATANNTQTACVLTLNAASKLITLQCNDAGTVDVAADPPSGAFLQFLIVVQNSGQSQ